MLKISNNRPETEYQTQTIKDDLSEYDQFWVIPIFWGV